VTEVKISIRQGSSWATAQIPAKVYGAFAVHTPGGAPTREWKRYGRFTVTHIATGMKVGDWPLKTARTIARRLNRVLPPGNFDDSDFETDPYQIFALKAKALIKEIVNDQPPSPTRRRPGRAARC
jgi:hypothetical protein